MLLKERESLGNLNISNNIINNSNNNNLNLNESIQSHFSYKPLKQQLDRNKYYFSIKNDKTKYKNTTNTNNTEYNYSNNKIENILYRMGWKGKGLGKYEQGIIKPLFTKIVGKKGEARIINENDHIDLETYGFKKYN